MRGSAKALAGTVSGEVVDIGVRLGNLRIHGNRERERESYIYIYTYIYIHMRICRQCGLV